MASKLTSVQLRYRNQIKRIMNAIKRENKKGSYVTIDVVVPVIKPLDKIEEEDIFKLQKITPTKIRESYDTFVQLEKLNSYKKEVKTWEQKRAEMDEEQLNELRETENDEVRDSFRTDRLAYDELTYRISQFGHLNDQLADYITMILNEEIKQYGYDATLGSILDMPEDLIIETEHVLKYQDDKGIRTRQIANMLKVIKGTTLSSEEMRTIEELMKYGDVSGN